MEDTIETTTVNKTTNIIPEMPSSVENNRLNTINDDPFPTDVRMKIRLFYETVRKSKFLVYFGLLLYICICLLGNIVTGVIFYKHQNISPQIDDIEDIAPLVPLNASKEYTEEEYLDLYQLFMNESNEQVSYHLIIS